jgi:hypothetical protein
MRKNVFGLKLGQSAELPLIDLVENARRAGKLYAVLAFLILDPEEGKKAFMPPDVFKIQANRERITKKSSMTRTFIRLNFSLPPPGLPGHQKA